MKYLVFVSASLFVQVSTAQVISYGVQSGPSTIQSINANAPRTITLQNNGYNLQNNAVNLQNIGVGIPLSNSNIQLTRNQPITNTVLTNGNLVTSNLGNNNYLSSNLGPNLVSTNLGTNVVSTNMGTNVISTNLGNTNFIPTNLAGGNVITANAGNNYVGANQNWVTANVPINLANGYNINSGSFAVGNSNIAQFFNNLPCGIQILGDALEVGGTVGVNGQLPFYTTVAVNGQLPSSGYGVVSCGCGGP